MILDFQHFHLVGIKGVAMTSLAQMLLDAGKMVTGSDVSEDFVTEEILDRLPIKITDLSQDLPADIDCVVYTAAHQGPSNRQVKLAQDKKIPCYSQAEALGEFFNRQEGIAVCGVGGKSTVSAMIAFILNQNVESREWKVGASFSVGVGNIPGLNKTGQWSEQSKYFVAEADEYVIDPQAKIPIPRFSFLQPKITVCTNLKFDHPDVYADFAATKQVYTKFFSQIKTGGSLIINADDVNLTKIKTKTKKISYGEISSADYRLLNYRAEAGKTISHFTYRREEYELVLSVPGIYNVKNALAAIAASQVAGVKMADSIKALSGFTGTKRRFEFIGEKDGLKFYDDYAHHPDEITAVIQALNDWYPRGKKYIAFQSHTFSRTKQLFSEFVASFAAADRVLMIDIFPSAREKADSTVSSDLLCQAIRAKYPQTQAENLGSIQNLAKFIKQNLRSGDILLTVGAGDIYEVHDFLAWQFNYPLGEHSYFKLGGVAEMYSEVAELSELKKIVKLTQKNQLKLTVIGGLSNVIVADEGVRGLVVKVKNEELRIENERLIAGAGINMSRLVNKSIEAGFSGLENFFGVPGTLGGAIYNNAHYQGDLISNYVSRVQVVNKEGQAEWLAKNDCDFAYDHSRFSSTGEIIWAVEFSLNKGDKKTSLAKIKAAQDYRAKTQPINLPSSGCIFRNLPNTPELIKLFPQFAGKELVPAGFLIDQAGLKNTKIGDLEVSDKHAAFIVNLGRGTSADLKKLIKLVKDKVKSKFGVELEEEVFYL